MKSKKRNISKDFQNFLSHTVQHRFDLNDDIQDKYFFVDFYNIYKDKQVK